MLKKILHYICVVIGCLIAAGSINVFLVQHHLLSGGLAGLGIISYYLFGLPAGTVTLALNVPLLVAAWRTLGKKYVAEIIFSTVMFSVCLDATEFMNHLYVTDDILLAAIYGGVFNGIGYGMILIVVAFFRELLGNGTLLGFQVVPDCVYEAGYMNNGMMTMPAMALIIVGCVIWAHRGISKEE